MEDERNQDDPGIVDVESVGLPITLYDRPLLSLSNLFLRGDIDAATRAIFTPNTLSPHEMQTFSQRLLGDNPNPMVKVVADVAMNPLVWVAVLASMKWPIGGPKAFMRIIEGVKNAPAVNRYASLLNGAHGNFRNIPGMWEHLGKTSDAVADLRWEWTKEVGNILEGVMPDERTQRLIRMKLEGLGETGSDFAKRWELPLDRPVVTGLQAKLGPRGMSISDKLKSFHEKTWSYLFPTKKEFTAFKDEMANYGQTVGDKVENYAHRVVIENPLDVEASQVMLAHHPGPTSKHMASMLNARTGKWGSLPELTTLRQMVADGDFPAEHLASIEKQIADRATQFADALRPGVLRARLSDEPVESLKKAIMELAGEGTNPAQAEAAAARVALLRGDAAKTEEGIQFVAKHLTAPAQYKFDLVASEERWIFGASNTYHWNIKGGQQKALDIFRQAEKAAVGEGRMLPLWQKSYLENEILPLSQGRMLPSSFNRRTAWKMFSVNRARWLREHPLVQQYVPKPVREKLASSLETGTLSSPMSTGSLIAHYMQLSTLGANPATAAKNLLQNPITVMNMPGIGPQGLYRGLKETLGRFGKYMESAGKGTPLAEAFEGAFPEYVKSMGGRENLIRHMVTSGDSLDEALRIPTKIGGAWERTKEGLMWMFGKSETANRVVGFYTGYKTALSAGATIEQAEMAGRTLVDIAHFTGGPLGTPRGLLGVNPALRQFVHFPARYLGFLVQSVRWGEDASRMDLGTLARTVGGSAAIYTVAKDALGIDLSSGLVSGALPLPQNENAPFYPIPVVPPAIGMVGSVVKAAATGQMAPLSDAGAMLVPGGLSARRLMRVLGPKRADYAHRTPDGKIPVYSDQGALLGTLTPFQLTMRAVGLQPTGPVQERAAAQWLLAQRNQIRDYRRRWLDAMMTNDMAQADRINQNYRKRYPELGPMQLKKSDIRSIHQRREMTRMSRIVQGFPREAQGMFRSAVTDASLVDFAQNLPTGTVSVPSVQ